MKKMFKYINPNTLRTEDVNGYVLCSQYNHCGYMHNAIPNDGVEGDYELMYVNKASDDYYYGMPVEGLGMINCMIRKVDCRPFTDNELKKLNHIQVQINNLPPYELVINDLIRQQHSYNITMSHIDELQKEVDKLHYNAQYCQMYSGEELAKIQLQINELESSIKRLNIKLLESMRNKK